MIKIENVSVAGFEPAIRGMRSPKNSWAKSDSGPGCNQTLCSMCQFKPQWCGNTQQYMIGPEDKKLAISLARGGSVHAKYRRMIVVWCDITAPLRWWKEFDTYRFGRERNSCSTMHKIDDHEFTSADFSEEDLEDIEACVSITDSNGLTIDFSSTDIHKLNVEALNYWRIEMVKAKKAGVKEREEHAFHQLINLLPESYMMRSTIMMSYEVLANAYFWRKNHKQMEWREFCKWAETLPYSWIFTTKPAREESVTFDDVESWLDKHSKELTPENRELLIEMLEQNEEPVTDDLPDSNQYFDIDLGQEEIRKAILNEFTPFPTSRMNLYLDGVQIGMLNSIERDDYALWRYKLHFVIKPIMQILSLTFPVKDPDPKFAERVRNVQRLWDSGKLVKSIVYNNATGSFDLHLSKLESIKEDPNERN